jgi:hypothetical protein
LGASELLVELKGKIGSRIVPVAQLTQVDDPQDQFYNDKRADEERKL